MALPQDGDVRTVRLLEAIANKVGVTEEAVFLSPDGGLRTLQLAELLARRFGILPPKPKDEDEGVPPVATVTKSIGTSSRDYSTITSWEADLDNTTPYDAGDDALGECYDDSAFDETFTINGGGTIGLASVTLSVASAERHAGTAGTGARIVRTGASAVIVGSTIPTTVQWLEVNGNGNSSVQIIRITSSAASAARYNILHGAAGTTSQRGITSEVSGAVTCDITNNFIYDVECTQVGTNDAYGIQVTHGGTPTTRVCNNTVHDIVKTNGSGDAIGIYVPSADADSLVQNNAATDPSGTTSGLKECFSIGSATEDHNLSSDATAAGTGSLTSKSSSNQFVSIVGGSEDLHLKAGADCINAGTDLGTTPTGVNIDIDGRDRDAEGDTWDIGADEYVSLVVAALRYVIGGGVNGIIGG